MKTGKPHVVPLTSAMLEVVDRVAPLATTPDSFLFPGQKDKKPLSGMAFEMLLRAMGVDATTHGFRSSFRVWAAEATTTHPDIAELCLSHIVGSAVTRAYQRSALIEKRRELLTLWSDYCTGRSVVGANVASFPMKKTAT